MQSPASSRIATKVEIIPKNFHPSCGISSTTEDDTQKDENIFEIRAFREHSRRKNGRVKKRKKTKRNRKFGTKKRRDLIGEIKAMNRCKLVPAFEDDVKLTQFDVEQWPGRTHYRKHSVLRFN